MTQAVSTPKFLEIPEIPLAIQDAAKRGKLVIFVGAGVSCLVDGPSWDQMADKLLSQLSNQNNSSLTFSEIDQLKSYNARTKISIAMDIWRGGGFVPLNLGQILQPRIADGASQVYKDLYGLNACFVTTNYDEWLDKLAEPSLAVD